MRFSYETQGAITYLVCEIDPTEQIDSLTLGMLTNNHIQGLAPVLYTEMNGQRFLKYNISAKLTADQFFGGGMNKQRTLTAFSNILSALCSADEYMIDQNCFSVAPEHIFLNVSNCETALICVPVVVDRDVNAEITELFKKILFTTQFDQSEDVSYLTHLITTLNSPNCNVYGLNDLVERLLAGNGPAEQNFYRPAAPQNMGNPFSQQGQQSQPAQPAAPASSFEQTITINEMDAQRGAPQQPTANPFGQAQQPAPAQPAVNPVQNQRTQPSGMTPPSQQPGMRQTVKPQAPQTTIPRPAANDVGFAIPGMATPTGATQPQNRPEPAKKESAPAAPTGNTKKMSFFDLLSHYSKENAALYKAQKEAEKKAKTAASAKPAAPEMKGQPTVPQTQTPATPAQNPQPFVQSQIYRPAVQPVPVQNSFNETTVLSPMMAGGETTVLSATPALPDPCLTRTKTGEKISINKPVFRIGKEKSYVDYFVGDNTAISRSHCNIHTENGEYYIEDTNSTNHTYVNGQILTSNVKTKLAKGDKVRLANEDFTFSV